MFLHTSNAIPYRTKIKNRYSCKFNHTRRIKNVCGKLELQVCAT